ncbi:MAG: hypothetical protein Q9159_002228 [Coniocarpon cinnabarinum]
MCEGQDVKVTLQYLAREELYTRVKPYLLNYMSDTSHHHNLVPYTTPEISVYDIRGREDEIDFDQKGFGVAHMHSAMQYEDYCDPKKVEEIYCTEVGACLIKLLGASSVQVFDMAVRNHLFRKYEHVAHGLQIRRRDVCFPSSRKISDRSQPTRQVHIGMASPPADTWDTESRLDSSHDAIVDLIKNTNGDKAEQLLNGRFVYVK